MVDAKVVEVHHIQRVIGVEMVGADNAVRHDFFLDDGQQCRCLRAGNDGRVYLPAPFEQAENSDFAGGSPAPPALAYASEIAFVSPGFSGELTARGFRGDEISKPHEERRGRVAVNPGDLRRRAGRGARHKQLDQFSLLP